MWNVVDDLVVKSRQRIDHLKYLEIVSNKWHKHQLKMNPLRCALGSPQANSWDFVVCHRGTKVNHAKIEVKSNPLKSRQSLSSHL